MNKVYTPEVEFDVHGVIMLCTLGNTAKKIVCVIENETKVWKRAGQIGLPGETLQKGENYQDAVFRGLEEELSIDAEHQSCTELGNLVFQWKAGEITRFANTKVFRIILDEDFFIPPVISKEIRGITILPEKNIRIQSPDDIRPGTLNALDIGFHRIHRTSTIQVFNGLQIS